MRIRSKYTFITAFTRNVQDREVHRDRKAKGSFQGPEGGREATDLMRINFLQAADVWHREVIVTQHCEYALIGT